MSDRAARRDRPSDRPGPSVPRPNVLEIDPSPSEAGQSTQQRRQLPSMCRDYNRREGCAYSDCQELHLCSYFLIDRCTDKRCAKAHDLETPRNILLLESLGWSGPGDMALALDIIRRRARGQVVSVCVMYNMGTCSASSCTRLHICYRHVLDTCPLDDCDLSHDLLDNRHNADLLTSAGLTDTPVPELLRRLQEQARRRPPQPDICWSVYGRQGCHGHCLRVHYCESLLNNRCRFGGRCTRSHSLKDPHNQRVLTFFGLTEEQMLRELKSNRRHISVPLDDRAPYKTEEEDDREDTSGQQSPCGGSESGDDAETHVKRAVSAEEPGRQVSYSLETPAVRGDRQRAQRVQRHTSETQLGLGEEEQREWQRKEKMWQKKEQEWQEKEEEWRKKEREWQEKEQEWEKYEEGARQEEDKLRQEIASWRKKEIDWEREKKKLGYQETKWQREKEKWQRKETGWRHEKEKWQQKELDGQREKKEWQKKETEWQRKEEKLQKQIQQLEKNKEAEERHHKKPRNSRK